MYDQSNNFIRSLFFQIIQRILKNICPEETETSKDSQILGRNFEPNMPV